MYRTGNYSLRGDEIFKIHCPKCKGKQGMRRPHSVIVKCFVCGQQIGRVL